MLLVLKIRQYAVCSMQVLSEASHDDDQVPLDLRLSHGIGSYLHVECL